MVGFLVDVCFYICVFKVSNLSKDLMNRKKSLQKLGSLLSFHPFWAMHLGSFTCDIATMPLQERQMPSLLTQPYSNALDNGTVANVKPKKGKTEGVLEILFENTFNNSISQA